MPIIFIHAAMSNTYEIVDIDEDELGRSSDRMMAETQLMGAKSGSVRPGAQI